MHHIILLHGALGSPSDLKELEIALGQYNYNVHTPTFSGHGNLPFQSRFGIIQFAAELETYILTNHLQGCSVFGYSMGGYVAMVLATKRPDLMGKIITLGTKFNWNEDSIKREKSLCQIPTIVAKQPDLAQSLRSTHHDWEMLVQKTSQMIGDFSGTQLLSDDTLDLIGNPVLLCLSEHDRMVGRDETDHVRKALKNAKFLMLSGSKHPLTTINMKVLSSNIHDFILAS